VPLHPDLEALLAARDLAGRLPVHRLSVEEARRQDLETAAAFGEGPPVAEVEDLKIPVPGGDIAIRRFRPDDARGALVWFHGGGWVLGGIDQSEAHCRRLASAAGAQLLSVGYRHAPEQRFTVAVEDCWAALHWAAERAEGHVAVGGASAGGNLAAVCAVRARDRGGPGLVLQVLVYPVCDHDFSRPSYIEHGSDRLPLGSADMAWFWSHYVPDPARRDDPEASPLRAADLSGVAPAWIVLPEYDPLRDEVAAYAERLRSAGVRVTVDRHDDMAHGFFSYVNHLEAARHANDAAGAAVRAALGGDDDDPVRPRLRAEPLGPQHQAHVERLLIDPRVGEWLGGVRGPDEIAGHVADAAAHWASNGFGYEAFFDADTGEFVGRGGLRRVEVGGREEVEIGWAVVPERWGEGIGTEIARHSARRAFDELGLRDVVAFTQPHNIASRRVMEKAGFAYERDVEYANLPHVLYRLRAPGS